MSWFTKGKSVNKSQLIEALSNHFEGNKKAAQHALESVIDTISREVVRGEKVAITGFGAFEKVVRPARMVRNPRTGERTRAKKTAVPKFRPGADLKAKVSGEKKLPRQSSVTARATASASGRPAKKAASKTAAKASTSTTAKKSASKTSSAKKASSSTTAKKNASKSTPAKKNASKTSAAKKSAGGAATKKTATGSATARKSAAKKSTAKKSTARKTTGKKTTAKRS